MVDFVGWCNVQLFSTMNVCAVPLSVNKWVIVPFHFHCSLLSVIFKLGTSANIEHKNV